MTGSVGGSGGQEDRSFVEDISGAGGGPLLRSTRDALRTDERGVGVNDLFRSRRSIRVVGFAFHSDSVMSLNRRPIRRPEFFSAVRRFVDSRPRVKVRV